jgi:hypothetical protein
MDIRFELFFCLSLLDGNFPNDQWFSPVDLCNDSMDHDACLVDCTILESLISSADSVGTVESARKGRVEIDAWDREF